MLFLQEFHNKISEQRQIILAGVPYNFCINACILVNQDVSHINDVTKRYLVVFLPKFNV